MFCRKDTHPDSEKKPLLLVSSDLEAMQDALQITTYRECIKKITWVMTGTLPLQAIKVAFPFINAIIISNLSTTDREAALLISTTEDFLRNVLNSPLFYVQTAVGVLNNESDKHKIGNTARAAWLLAFLISTPQVVLLVFSKPILNKVVNDSNITNVVRDFFNIYAASTPLLSLQLATEQITLGTEKIYFPLLIQSCGLVVYLSLVFPLTYGSPKLGIEGTAWAFLARGIAYGLVSFGSLAILSKSERMFAPYNLFDLNATNKEFISTFMQLCLKGAPLFFIICSELGSLYLTNMLISKLSINYLTPQLIISQYQDLLLIPTWAFASAAQNEISNNVKNNKQSIMRLGNVSIALSLIAPAIYTSLTIFSPRLLMRPFISINDPGYQDTLDVLVNEKLFLISAASIALLDLRYVTTQAIIGTRRSSFMLTVNMLLTWIGVAIGAYLAYGKKYNGILSLNLGLMGGFFISALAQLIYWGLKARVSALEKLEQSESKQDSNVIISNAGSIDDSQASSAPHRPTVSSNRSAFFTHIQQIQTLEPDIVFEPDTSHEAVNASAPMRKTG